jgi:hypothetical protein
VELTVEDDDIIQLGNHTSRIKSCRPIAGVITSNRDDDFLGRHHASTDKNLEREQA